MQNGSSASDGARRYARLIAFYGEQGFGRIRASGAAVVGLGGVGGHAALALAMSGVGRLLLIDFDTVTLTSLNRLPVAGPGDVGRLKTEVMAEHLRRTCPDTRVDTRAEFIDPQRARCLLDAGVDVVIDAIDSLNPKVGLLEFCRQAHLPVVSAMGASGRRDPTRIRSADLAETQGCPLARAVRRRLRRRGIDGGIWCIFSDEEAGETLPPDLEEPGADRGRVRRTLPSQVTVPGIFGYAAAAHVLERMAPGAFPG